MTGGAEHGGTPKKKRRPAWMKGFLDALTKNGVVAYACKIVGVGRTTVYRFREEDPDFAAAWDAAIEQALDDMEVEAWRRAVRGVRKPVFYQGSKVGTIKEYSDTLLIFLLKGGRPEKFRDRYQMEHSGPGNGPMQHQHSGDLFDRISRHADIFREAARRALVSGLAASDDPQQPLESPGADGPSGSVSGSA